MTEPSPKRALLARTAVLLAAAWLLTGALAKLFVGNPMAMPASVRDHSPFGLDLTYHLVIAIELSLVAIAVLRPRIGWLPLAGTYGFFLCVLTPLILSGATNCGCMGDKISLHPLVMFSIDASLLAFLLAMKPWSALRGRGAPWIALAAAVAFALAAPWAVIRSVDTAAPGTGPSGPAAPVDARYFLLEPERWVGKNVFEVAELTRWVAPDALPLDGSIVLWRQSCSHCAAHLRKMTAADDGSRQILLMQVQDELDKGREVDVLPSGTHVTTFAFPVGLEGAVETPCEVRVEGGVVVAAEYTKHDEPAAEPPGGG